MWMVFAFVRLCGNWPGFGRIDEILGPYLKKDLADGTITVDEAREVLASFFIKGCEWILSDTPLGSGDAQHYQNIILAGIDCDGHEVTNEVTYLVLDVVEELPISDFPISVRVNSKTPAKLLRKMARVIRHGGGIVAVYNEELVLRAMVKEGYDIREARKFGNDGCWEVQVPGSTCFTYHPFDSLQVLNAALGFDGNKDVPDCKNIDEVFDLFHAELAETVKGIYERRVKSLFGKVDGKWCGVTPYIQSSVISLFENGCIENAASYFDLGPIYTTRSPHIGGAPDVGNSLYAISKIVFEEKKLTLPELGEILKNNWEDHEELRQYVRNKLTYYGNDCDESDAYTSRVLNDFADIVHALAEKDHPCKLIPGVSTFGRQLEWRPMRCAVAFGFKKGDILSGNDSPTPGTDFSGATAIVKSYCKADLEKQSCGAALDIKLYPDTLNGNDGINALVSLIRGFVELDGYFMQMDVIDKAILLAARDNPQEYKTLSVRVSGWNARFVTLAREWQDMIIERTGQNV